MKIIEKFISFKISSHSPWASEGFAPPRGSFLDHNIIVPTCLSVRKMHVGTRIKGAFGDYGLFYQTLSNWQKIRISNFKQLLLP